MSPHSTALLRNAGLLKTRVWVDVTSIFVICYLLKNSNACFSTPLVASSAGTT